MKNKDNIIIGGTIAFALLFAVTAVLFKVFEIEIFPSQIYGALMGSVITCIITLLLLRGQTSSEELKERNMAVFNQKQAVYHRFIEELHKIVRDGEITIESKKAGDPNGPAVDELKDLIFQLGLLQMHAKPDTFNTVKAGIMNMIAALNSYNDCEEKDKSKEAPKFYDQLSQSLFKITNELRKELYTDEGAQTKEGEISELLGECGLSIEYTGFDKKDAQEYFWTKLKEKLEGKGMEFIDESIPNFKEEIEKYYAKKRPRYKWYNYSFKAPGCNVAFTIEIDKNYYYGVKKIFEPKKNLNENIDPEKVEAYFKDNPRFNITRSWYGWTCSQDHNLNFWTLDSKGFEQFLNDNNKEKFIKGIADEIEGFVTDFVEKYNKN